MKKIKVLIDSDEWYPVYSIYSDGEGWGDLVEVTQDLLDRYKKVYADFKAMQKELKEIYNKR